MVRANSTGSLRASNYMFDLGKPWFAGRKTFISWGFTLPTIDCHKGATKPSSVHRTSCTSRGIGKMHHDPKYTPNACNLLRILAGSVHDFLLRYAQISLYECASSQRFLTHNTGVLDRDASTSDSPSNKSLCALHVQLEISSWSTPTGVHKDFVGRLG